MSAYRSIVQSLVKAVLILLLNPATAAVTPLSRPGVRLCIETFWCWLASKPPLGIWMKTGYVYE